MKHWRDLSTLRLAEAGALRQVVVPQPVRLGALEGAEFLNLLAVLRDLRSENVGVVWHLVDEELPCDLADVSFLPPPQGDGRLARAWRDLHSFGSFYWRAGPGFVIVQDLRRPHDRKRLVLDAPEELACFERHLEVAVPDSTAEARECVELLRGEGVLLGTNGPWLLALPMRLKQWPIPSPLA